MINPELYSIFGRNYVRQTAKGVEVYDKSTRSWVLIETGNQFIINETRTKRYYQENPSGRSVYDAKVWALIREEAEYKPEYDRPLSKVELPFFIDGEPEDPDFIQKKSLNLPDYKWLTNKNVYENYSYYAAERNHVNNINAYNATIYALKKLGIDFKIEVIDSIKPIPGGPSRKPFCFYHNGLEPKLPFYFKDSNEMCYFWDTRLGKLGEPTFISRPFAVSRRFQNAIVFNGLRPDRDANRYGYSPFLHYRQYTELPPFQSFSVNMQYTSFVNSISGVSNNSVIINTPPPVYLTPHHPIGIIHCLFEASLLVEGKYLLIKDTDKNIIDYFFIADSYRWVTYSARSISSDVNRFVSSKNTPSPKYTKIITDLNFNLGEFDDLFETAILKVPPNPPDPFNSRIKDNPLIETNKGYLYSFRGYKPSFEETLSAKPFFASKEAHVRIGFGSNDTERFFYGERISPFTGSLSINHMNEFQCAKPINYPSHYNLQIIKDTEHFCYDSLTPFVIPYRFLKSNSVRRALVFQDMGQRDFVISSDKDLEQQKISFTQTSTYNLFSYYTEDIYDLNTTLSEAFIKIIPEPILIKDGGKARPIIKQFQQLPTYYEKLGAGVMDYFDGSFWNLKTEINPVYSNSFAYKDGFSLSVNKVSLTTHKSVNDGIIKTLNALSLSKIDPQVIAEVNGLLNLMKDYWVSFFSPNPIINSDIIKNVVESLKKQTTLSYGAIVNSFSAIPFYEKNNKDILVSLISPRALPRARNLFYAGLFQGFLLGDSIKPSWLLAVINHDSSNIVTGSIISKLLYLGERFSSLNFDIFIEGFELKSKQEVIDYDMEVFKRKVG